MPKTEVILTHNVVGLGAESDHVKVSPGYARNYLFPQGLAIPLSAANKRRIEVLRQRRAEREAHEFNSMSELSKSISKLICLVKVKTGDDGKMFGAVTSGTIADELKHQFDISLDKRKIHLDHPIRNLGDFEVELRLHPEVTTTLKVHVESTTPPPAPPEEPAEAKDKAKGPPRRREFGRGRPAAKGEEAKPGEKAAEGAPAAKTARPARPFRQATPRPRARPPRAEKPAKAEPAKKAE